MAITGKYNVKINTPMGTQEGVLNLEEADGTLSGTMEQGGDSVPISNGRVQDGVATWDVSVSKPMPLTLSFEGRPSGDMMTGTVQLGSFGNSTFEAMRV